MDEIIEEAKKKVELEKSKLEAHDDVEFFGARSGSRLSTPTPEGGSPTSSRPMGFEDDFKATVRASDSAGVSLFLIFRVPSTATHRRHSTTRTTLAC